MRLVLVSNRLPITVKEAEGALSFIPSAGGLVTGLSAYLDSLKQSSDNKADYLWIGWPGITVDDNKKERLTSELTAEYSFCPVFLPNEVMEKFYHGFCNKTIWPLFHYFPSYTIFDEVLWSTYKQVNEAFCETIIQNLKPNDFVWIHDYHLMLLPKLIREKAPDIPIGFFLHIPFPSYEIFRMLPGRWRGEILEGLLGADLIGFHTHDYTQYFLRCVLRILGHENNMGQIFTSDNIIKAETFPMGIDFKKLYDSVSNPEIQREKNELNKIFIGLKVILSIDRLDYTKGILNRLRSYEMFLEKNPQWHGKVILLLIVVPSRVGIEHYQLMKKQIDELVGNITSKFGNIGWSPISYHFRSFDFNHLVALYNLSDIALITPLRDGMNLIAKEYIATKTDQKGVLILSEMTGAVKELGEAIIINPNNIEEIAEALKNAMEMPEDEQKRRNQVMQIRLKRYNIIRWADDFIKELFRVKDEQKRIGTSILNAHIKEQLVGEFWKARKRLLFFDYDGTLVPFADHPSHARPGEKLLKLLEFLNKDKKTELVIISGRDRFTLQEWFGTLGSGLVAEHGVWIKEKKQDWKMIKPLVNDWKPKILPILESYTDRIPGSFIEEKEFSLVWHYRRADPELGSMRAKELLDDLVGSISNLDIQVFQGAKVIEIRSAGVNKGVAGMLWISKSHYDFIMAIGDDWTDEDLFKVLPDTAYSIRVGMTHSYARFNLPNYLEVIKLIEEIVK